MVMDRHVVAEGDFGVVTLFEGWVLSSRLFEGWVLSSRLLVMCLLVEPGNGGVHTVFA